MTKEEIVFHTAMSWLNTPYKWGGQTPYGIDCSGLIQELLKASGDYPTKGEDKTAQGLYLHFLQMGKIVIQAPTFGALSFYGKDIQHITHVAFCLNAEFCIEAGSGDSSVNDLTDAIAKNSFVRTRPVRARKDLVAIVKVITE